MAIKDMFDWKKRARKEGRLCTMCREPVPKNVWNDKDLNHLCSACFIRESGLRVQPRRYFKIGRS